jgi:glucosamine--fructose-6-phosphate aminotransferase (isomerizing)
MTQQPEIRQAHPYFMYDAITGQPEAMVAMLDRHAETAREVADVLSTKRHIYIVGIGTSWHAVLVAERWFRRFAGPRVPVQGWHSFEFCGYPPALGAEDAVIIISHRGTKTYSFMALDLAGERGAYTVAVTSTAPGLRLQVADTSFHTVSPERSSAFTISYTTALTALAMLNLAMARTLADADNRLSELPHQIAQILAAEDDVKAIVTEHHDKRRFISAGWGANTANAYEVALKIKETSRADCEGFQIEQLLHGPFCSLDHDCLLTIIATPGDDRGRAGDLARAAEALGTPVWALSNRTDSELADASARIFPLPDTPSYLAPIASVVPLQLFTYRLALARGTHPDLFQQDLPGQAAARVHYDL